MTAVERSPMGDERQRPVACATCRRSTWNWSALCEKCKRKNWAPEVRVFDALRSVSAVGSAARRSPPPAAAAGPTGDPDRR